MHPGAWWAWAICVAAAVSQITNPLLLAIAMAAVVFVVLSRRTDAPWARAFRWYFYLGVFVIGTRVVLYILVGAKTGDTVVIQLPTINMPSWAAGIQLLGPISIEGLVVAACEGLRLAAMFLCFGAANALANPLRAQIISLSLFVNRHSSAVMRGEETFQDLIDINRMIMQGLSGGAQAA